MYILVVFHKKNCVFVIFNNSKMTFRKFKMEKILLLQVRAIIFATFETTKVRTG